MCPSTLLVPACDALEEQKRQNRKSHRCLAAWRDHPRADYYTIPYKPGAAYVGREQTVLHHLLQDAFTGQRAWRAMDVTWSTFSLKQNWILKKYCT